MAELWVAFARRSLTIGGELSLSSSADDIGRETCATMGGGSVTQNQVCPNTDRR